MKKPLLLHSASRAVRLLVAPLALLLALLAPTLATAQTLPVPRSEERAAQAGDFEKALKYADKALAKAQGDSAKVAVHLRRLYYLGERALITEAEALQEQLLKDSRGLPNPMKAQVQLGRGAHFARLGYASRAIETLENAAELAERGSEPWQQAHTRLAEVYIALGMPQAALKSQKLVEAYFAGFLQGAIDKEERDGSLGKEDQARLANARNQAARADLLLAAIHLAQNDYEGLSKALQNRLLHPEEGPNKEFRSEKELIAWALYYKAQGLDAQDNAYLQAELAWEEAIKAMKSAYGSKHHHTIAAQMGYTLLLGRRPERLNDYQRATNDLQKRMEDMRESGNLAYAKLALDYAYGLMELNNDAAAGPLLNDAVAILDEPGFRARIEEKQKKQRNIKDEKDLEEEERVEAEAEKRARVLALAESRRNLRTTLKARAYHMYAVIDLNRNRQLNAKNYLLVSNQMLDEATPGRGSEAPTQYAYNDIELGRWATLKYEFDEAYAYFDRGLEPLEGQLKAANRRLLRYRHYQANAYLAEKNFEAATDVLVNVQKEEEKLFGIESTEYVSTGADLGQLYVDRGMFPQAKRTLENASTAAENLSPPQPFLQIRILESLADMAQAQGNFAQAEEYFLRAVRLKKRRVGNDDVLIAESAVKLAELYQNQGRFSEAIRILERSIALFEQTGRTGEQYTDALQALARVFNQIGKYKEAETLALKYEGVMASKFAEGSLQVADANVLMASIITNMGRYPDAEARLRKALTVYRSTYGSNNINPARLNAQLSEVLFYQEKREEAFSTLNGAIEEAENAVGPEGLDVANMQSLLAKLYISTGDYPKADALLQNVLNIQFVALGDEHPDYLRTIGVRAALLKVTGAYDASEVEYKELLTGWKRTLGENHPDYAFYLADYADLKFRQGDIKRARKTYDEATELMLNLVDRYFPALSEAEKADFWLRISNKLENFYIFMLEAGNEDPRLLAQAYDLRLKTKALLLSQSIGIRNQIANSGDEEVKALFEEWIAKREQLARAYTLTRDQIKEQAIDLAAIENDINELEAQLSLKSNLFAKLNSQEEPTWRNVRRVLGADEAAVEILRIRAGTPVPEDSVVYAALVLKPSESDVRLVVMNEGNLMERRYLLNYSRSITNKFDDQLSYRKFWAKLDSALLGVERVYLSTDGVYNQLSLPSLRKPGGGFVLDETDIRFVSNTRYLINPEPPTYYEGKTAVLIGNPDYNEEVSGDRFTIPELAGTQEEVDNIERTLNEGGWRITKYTREEANELLLKQTANPILLHIATHGFFYPIDEEQQSATNGNDVFGLQGAKAAENPLLRAGLFLAGASHTLADDDSAATITTSTSIDNNGIITAFEVMNMDLSSTELVILSACETGLGEIRNGEGVYGLQRAFAVAGAETVVMSLWRVSDEVTQKMISLFYENWITNGMEKHAAFKKAQQSIRQEYEDPYYWGAFVMVSS